MWNLIIKYWVFILGMSLGMLITKTYENATDRPVANNPEIIKVDPGLIGVYTPFDIFWINPRELTVVTENSEVDLEFKSIDQLSDWTERNSADHTIVRELLGYDEFVYWKYCGDEKCGMEIIWWNEGRKTVIGELIPDDKGSWYPVYSAEKINYSKL